MPHQVFVGVAQNVIVLGAVLGKVEFWLLEDADEIGQTIDHRLAFTELVRIIEVGEVAAGKPRVGLDQRLDHLRIDLVADVALPLSAIMSLKLEPLGMLDRRCEVIGVAYLSEMYLMNSMNRT